MNMGGGGEVYRRFLMPFYTFQVEADAGREAELGRMHRDGRLRLRMRAGG